MEYSLKAALKERGHSLILTVEPNAVGDIEPLDCSAEIGPRGLDLQMVMVGHQHVAVNPHPKTSAVPCFYGIGATCFSGQAYCCMYVKT
jgi:hypothetical protein